MTSRNPQQTRDNLVQTAFQEIHRHGFQGMRVDEVLRLSGLRKGAFYHHFSSKTALGYAVVEEQIRPLVRSIWLEPLTEMDDPIRELPRMLDALPERIPPMMREHGCPLNNLAQEMVDQDDGFRQRLLEVLNEWIDALEATVERGKIRGYLRDDIDSRAVARFIVAALEGCIGVAKVDRSPEQWRACRSQIAAYLGALEPHAG